KPPQGSASPRGARGNICGAFSTRPACGGRPTSSDWSVLSATPSERCHVGRTAASAMIRAACMCKDAGLGRATMARLEHDPEKCAAFSEKIMLRQEPRGDGDSKKSHHALVPVDLPADMRDRLLIDRGGVPRLDRGEVRLARLIAGARAPAVPLEEGRRRVQRIRRDVEIAAAVG